MVSLNPNQQARVSDTAQAPAEFEAKSEPPYGPPLSKIIEELSRLLRQVKEFALYYVAARGDSIRSSIRRAVMMAAVGALAALVGATILITASVLLLVGAGRGVGELFGGRLWLGHLVVGGGVLLVTGLAVWIILKRRASASRRKTIEKYEQRKDRQRRQFGRDVAQVAADRQVQ